MQRIVQSKVVAHWRERDGDIMTSKDKEHLIENHANYWRRYETGGMKYAARKNIK